MGKKTWIRDCLHDLRRFAQEEGLVEADRALRDAIVRVSCEAGTATKLSIQDLVDFEMDEAAVSRSKDP